MGDRPRLTYWWWLIFRTPRILTCRIFHTKQIFPQDCLTIVEQCVRLLLYCRDMIFNVGYILTKIPVVYQKSLARWCSWLSRQSNKALALGHWRSRVQTSAESFFLSFESIFLLFVSSFCFWDDAPEKFSSQIDWRPFEITSAKWFTSWSLYLLYKRELSCGVAEKLADNWCGGLTIMTPAILLKVVTHFPKSCS